MNQYTTIRYNSLVVVINLTNQNNTTMTNTAKHRRTKKYTHKFRETKSTIVTFIYKSWQAILQSIDNLKRKYRKVVLITQTPLGAGLFSGSIEIG